MLQHVAPQGMLVSRLHASSFTKLPSANLPRRKGGTEVEPHTHEPTFGPCEAIIVTTTLLQPRVGVGSNLPSAPGSKREPECERKRDREGEREREQMRLCAIRR